MISVPADFESTLTIHPVAANVAASQEKCFGPRQTAHVYIHYLNEKGIHLS